MNKAGDAEDLRSQAAFARLNADNTWQSLPDLPEPRSSHDAAVVGNKLYVVGGWNMQGSGGSTAKWHDTALSVNLADPNAAWKPIAPPPFKRRALALAEFQGRLYCIGGMQSEGGPTTAVAIYDPKTDQWSDGPHLLGGPMDGFGAAAYACQGGLYVTTSSGSIQRLNADGKSWEYVGQLAHPRFFHRMLPWQNDKLVIVGGANMGTGKTNELELLDLSRR
jgi:N-acetylneuraminic acid mutarotase